VAQLIPQHRRQTHQEHGPGPLKPDPTTKQQVQGPHPHQRPQHRWTESEGESQTQRSFHQADDWATEAAKKVPMGTLGQPDEIAEIIVLLLSPRSGVVTGSVIDWDQIVIGGHD
jgi:NAD(P)-dependent dehydrogenase (short-subunit alcohol dehydrogenase family)